MPIRFALCAAVISLALGIAAILLLWEEDGGTAGAWGTEAWGTGAWGLLELDADCPVEALEGLWPETGGPPESDFTQWVLVNEFDHIEKVPLRELEERLEPYDPRNDGYARKLEAFFVRDGRRLVFFPLKPEASPKKLEKKIVLFLAEAFPQMPYRLSLFVSPQPLVFFIVMFLAAFAGAFFSSGRPLGFLLSLPALLPFAWGGFPGFILAGVLAACGGLLREPLRELLAAGQYPQATGTASYAGPGFRGLLEQLRPFRGRCLLALWFFLLLSASPLVTEFPPLPLLLAMTGFFIILYLSHKAEFVRSRKMNHRRFVPVQILRGPRPSFFSFMAPFIAGALGVLFLSSFLSPHPKEDDASLIPPDLITREEYEAHGAYQAAFSLVPLGEKNSAEEWKKGLPNDGIMRYYTGEDGLITGAGEEEIPGPEIPPFPLEELMNFLLHYRLEKGRAESAVTVKELILGLLAPVSCLPLLFQRRRTERDGEHSSWRDKRIAA